MVSSTCLRIVLALATACGPMVDAPKTMARVVTGVAQDAGYDVLREFWPEITRKFKLPFRDKPQPDLPSSGGAPATF
jgi:hypothetical protein